MEALLTKCKDSIKANKQKTQALTDVKDSLSTALSAKETECSELSQKLDELEKWKKRMKV